MKGPIADIQPAADLRKDGDDRAPGFEILRGGLSEYGYMLIRVPEDVAVLAAETEAEARRFFSLPLEERRRHSVIGLCEGYRDLGVEYSIVQDRPDLNESFSYWFKNAGRPEAALDGPGGALQRRMAALAAALHPIARCMLRDLAAPFGAAHCGSEDASGAYLQINRYRPSQHRRDTLQDRHEDGHLLTLARGSSAGLEVDVGGSYLPLATGPDEFAVMPGELLELMSGGHVRSLYHRVLNDGVTEERISMMLFVNPDLTGTVEPWVRNATNAGVDLTERTRNNPLRFGLPPIEGAPHYQPNC